MVHQPRQELHRQILEGERRPVKQLEHEGVRRKLRERRDRRMAERAVGVVRHAREFGVRDRAADERFQDLAGDLGVTPPGQRRDLLARENRP